MNYRSILKEFDQSIVAENKKLMETYNKLLKESEDVCPKCKKSPCVCDKEEVTECGDQVQEDDMLKDREHNLHISAKKFFENEDDVTDDVAPVEGDEKKEVPEVTPDETVADDTNTVDEGDDDGNLVSAEEFFGKEDNSDDSTDDTTDTSKEAEPVEKTGDDEGEKVDEASKTMTPSSLFEDEEKKDEEEKPVEGDEKKEEVKEPDEVDHEADKSEDKAEFFAEECNKKEEKKDEPVEKVDEDCTGEKNDDKKKEEIKEEVEDKEKENKEPVGESEEDDEEMTDSEKEMKELQESMDAVKMFVKANKRFFPVNG